VKTGPLALWRRGVAAARWMEEIAGEGSGMMTRFALITAAVLLSVSSALAEPLCNGTLADYLTGGSYCEFDGFRFGDFQYNGTASAPGAAGITVGSIEADGEGGPAGLVFTPTTSWSNSEVWIRYTVTLSPAAGKVFDQVAMNASLFGIISTASVDTYICGGSGFSSTNPASCGAAVGGISDSAGFLLNNAALSGSADLSAYPTLDTIGILDHIVLNPIYSQVNSLQNTFSYAVPEPATNLLVGVSLLLFAAVLGRRRKRGSPR